MRVKMKKIITLFMAMLVGTTAMADQELVFPPFIQQDMNAIVLPAPPAPVLPQKPLVKKITWIMTPNVTFVEAPYYSRGLFGGVVVKKQIVLHTTWVWTPIEVWE